KQLGKREWVLLRRDGDRLVERPMMQLAILYDRISEISPGAGIGAFANNQLGVYAPYTWGNEMIQERWIEPAARGDKVISFCNTEPSAGSDVKNIQTEAKRDGDDWVISGRKMYITNAVEADALVVSTVTDPLADDPRKGQSLFIIDSDTPGVEVRPLKKLHWDPASLAFIQLNEVRVPTDQMLGNLNEGFDYTMATFTNGRIGVAAMTMGTAVGALRLAHLRAKRRKIYGTTLWELRSKRHEFAEMAIIAEAGRLLYRKAAWLRDNGKDFSMAASMAKLFATEKAMELTMWAAYLHGGSGVLEENRIHRYPLDAWASAMGEGAPEVQRLLIARSFDDWIEQF
ncbi:MAG: acyl-CoA dehydrogenase family protein, partial [Candidatus Thermoplasmatota archaeon]|nr:acyl-CoA dehydrogenase family protein [Candidatus Thermoplasmatota archaeon]